VKISCLAPELVDDPDLIAECERPVQQALLRERGMFMQKIFEIEEANVNRRRG
jgi:hypothetical protein